MLWILVVLTYFLSISAGMSTNLCCLGGSRKYPTKEGIVNVVLVALPDFVDILRDAGYKFDENVFQILEF